MTKHYSNLKDYKINKIQVTSNSLYFIFENYYWYTMTPKLNSPIINSGTVVL